MEQAGDRTALLSHRDDEESIGLGSHPADVLPASNNSVHGGRGITSKLGKKSTLAALLKLNLVTVVTTLMLLVLFGGIFAPFLHGRVFRRRDLECTSVKLGYQCNQPFAQLWGQYSPYSSLKSKSPISPDVPSGCTITFAQVLSRHGARYPTKKKTELYAKLFDRIKETSKSYEDDFKFLKNFEYTLKSDDMTEFGNTQLFNSGAKFYDRYRGLAKEIRPFVRAAGSPRVIKSAERFIQGFQKSLGLDPDGVEKDRPPIVNLIIPEGESSNNTLDHSLCENFEQDNSGKEKQKKFVDLFAPPILERVKTHLPGANITVTDVIYLMDMCSFHTVMLTPDASKLSPFCQLFTPGEWVDYDYYQSLGKYYRYGPGSPLGAEQGMGFTNELIARLTNTPVNDSTSTNRTLTSHPTTFPLNATLYADFSHDNTMITIFTALGLFNSTEPLPLDRIRTPVESDGFSASWTVPFAGRAYVEKMKCDWSPRKDDEFVRILLNDRVYPLHGCNVDSLGRCEVNDFVKGLSYAASGGMWDRCFIKKSGNS
ncbi:3-phytase A precursor, putative [Coccidioides posadasii C735 delta SOWgp]|uniref:3-phytase n=1 Tax=Coccidioides posadasii (strain C735) TaxID=222929 RepID=C5PJN7_COCP7|nr:3-phytase A precursor, putative [Coccidioides posadasii C735 delta SOWgp]EER22936.1 3-phytase A precursor, putative [Coccidioides posadasii C735 delta SOWgp]|eukprot:XP_003065081.1 3-phytase A precursor, putative [Coccidioides posadasii C735 delta SOWgp]